MRDRDLYAKILRVERPWIVTSVDLDEGGEEVSAHLQHKGARELPCPQCGAKCGRYDHRTRRWRHLDTCQYRTILVAEIPRVECKKHGVLQVVVPWAEPGSRFTALFEALAIEWLLEASLSAVARRLGLSWDQMDSIQRRAVHRGLARRKSKPPARIGVDETSFQKRHEYVTVVTDLDRSRVLYVGDGRTQKALDGFYESLSDDELASIDAVAMDMFSGYINSTRRHVPGAERKIAFDKFHVAKHISDAVNEVRKREHRELRSEGDNRLTRTKYF